MFSHIEFKGLRQSALFGYAADTPFFKGRRKLMFKPGLNILYGPNGSGKSTVLRILGDTMCATQGGFSTVTENALRDTIEIGFGRKSALKDKIGLKVAHDGQPVVFCDPRTGIKELSLRKSSHGQASVARLNGALAILEGKSSAPTDVVHKFTRSMGNDTWRKALDMLEERMKSTIEKGQVTVLLDEPEANMAVRWQSQLWGLLARPEVAERLQLIIASHSPFALGISHANYIDIVPDYRDEAQSLLTAHFLKIHGKS